MILVPIQSAYVAACGFLLVCHSGFGPILHHFRDIAGFFVLATPPFHNNFGVFPLHQIAAVGSI